MKVIISGYGKMGHMIEGVLQRRGIELVCASEDICAIPREIAKECVCIDFTTPEAFRANYKTLAANFKAVVVGTTGWYDIKEEVYAAFEAAGTPMIWGSNYSVGVLALFAGIERACEVLKGHGYTPHVEEIHHIHKLDAPSGTAITLAKDIIEELDRKDDWRLMKKGTRIGKGIIPITAVREGEVAGIHEVVYDSEIDTITLRHAAKSRKGLALGAVLAAEYLEDKHGYFTMKDLLKVES